MREALTLAELARQQGEVPVGAVVVKDSAVIGRGFNQPVSSHDPTAHAEVQAIRDAARHIGNYRLSDCILVVTVEPCTMCAGALIHARVKQLVFGAREPRAGAVVSSSAVLDNPDLNHRVDVLEGVLADESSELMKTFFKERR